jgi:hypothetical protein
MSCLRHFGTSKKHATHDLRRGLLTSRGSGTGLISFVPIHPFFSSFILARTPHHAPVKGAATGNAYIAFVAHDLRRGLLTCRGFATGVISSVPIHPFFSSFILARTTWLRHWCRCNSPTNRQPNHAPVKGAATGNANIAFTGSRRLYACVSQSTKYSAKDSGRVTKEALRGFILARTSWLRH